MEWGELVSWHIQFQRIQEERYQIEAMQAQVNALSMMGGTGSPETETSENEPSSDLDGLEDM